jgi:hypothetical protein
MCKPLLWHKYPAEEDKDMAEQEAKTKTIGYLPTQKVQSLKGWDEYVDKSSKLSIVRREAQKAKNSVREALKERLNEGGELDFVAEGDRIRVFRVFRKEQLGRRTRSLDLSSSFREELLEGKDGSAEHPTCNEAEQPKLNLNAATEQCADLDPVTERLMAIMNAKSER